MAEMNNECCRLRPKNPRKRSITASTFAVSHTR
jgi:hypothetical protein